MISSCDLSLCLSTVKRHIFLFQHIFLSSLYFLNLLANRNLFEGKGEALSIFIPMRRFAQIGASFPPAELNSWFA